MSSPIRKQAGNTPLARPHALALAEAFDAVGGRDPRRLIGAFSRKRDAAGGSLFIYQFIFPAYKPEARADRSVTHYSYETRVEPVGKVPPNEKGK